MQFGCGGIYLFPLTELESGQVGYSVATDGTPLEGERDGEWRPSWLDIWSGHPDSIRDDAPQTAEHHGLTQERDRWRVPL